MRIIRHITINFMKKFNFKNKSLQISSFLAGLAVIALIIVLLYSSTQTEDVSKLILSKNIEPFELVDNSTLNTALSSNIISQGIEEIGTGVYNVNNAFAAYLQITKFNSQENAKKYFSEKVTFWKEKSQKYEQMSFSQVKMTNKLVLQGITKGTKTSTYDYVWRDRIFIYEVSGKKLDVNYPLKLSKLLWGDFQ